MSYIGLGMKMWVKFVRISLHGQPDLGACKRCGKHSCYTVSLTISPSMRVQYRKRNRLQKLAAMRYSNYGIHVRTRLHADQGATFKGELIRESCMIMNSAMSHTARGCVSLLSQ